MKFGVNLAPFGPAADPRVVLDLGQLAEQTGWDGFFLWDHINWTDYGPQLCDPGVALAALAAVTTRIRLGPMVTPLPRRRPTKLARELASLDCLSEGRVILGVGLGSPELEEFAHLGEVTSARTRGRMCDESLRLMNLLWRGKPLNFEGEFYRARTQGFLPTPVQKPRIPTWIAAMLPAQRGPLARAARYDGIIPFLPEPRAMTPEEVAALAERTRQGRKARGPFEVVVGAYDRSLQEPYEKAGCTWWVEGLDPWRGSLEDFRALIGKGPRAL